ncbi:hypothetical protein [uncultured Paraglaciecola sp.]|uniref:hypothetical protein n=1 Tax=uncultured Paraglaciecola sp. TaxID=1765024 RepID=UPI00260B3EE7|nr:hypothetical protein [uncultured Paraglaciecola sp.]
MSRSKRKNDNYDATAEENQYPKWVNGIVCQDAEEEDALLGVDEEAIAAAKVAEEAAEAEKLAALREEIREEIREEERAKLQAEVAAKKPAAKKAPAKKAANEEAETGDGNSAENS